MKLSLKEHIQRSREAVSANKAKGNRHAEILTGLYTNLNRFIEEVMQNAEDAYSRKAEIVDAAPIKFILFNDRIEILHNGKDFDEEDLMSVTTFANTTKDKRNEINLIGKFGIGFKSVFAITDNPEIHSGDFHYRIDDYEILEEVFPVDCEKDYRTRIILPFKNENKKEIFNSVRSGLMQIDAKYLLFLNKIKNIIIVFENGAERTIEYSSNRIKGNCESKKFIYRWRNESRCEEYLTISELENSDSKISLAFKLDIIDGEKKIVPCNNQSAFVYFPTLHITGLNFFINARFTTTPTREYIPFDKFKSPENLKILKDVGEFYRKALVNIKDIGFFDSTIFEILPLKDPEHFLFNNKENEIYRTFFDITVDVLKKRKIIPVKGKRYSYASETAFSLSDKITILLKRNDLELLFNRSEWFENNSNTSISENLLNYLENKLDVKKVDEESLAFRIAVNPLFFNDKNEKWFISFYEFLYENRKLWDKEHSFNYYSLRNKPVILTDNDKLMPGFDDNDMPIVYLASGKTKQHNIVRRSLLKNEKVLCFFKELGLSEPDMYADVMNSLPIKYNSSKELKFSDYSKDLLKVLHVYFNDSVLRKAEMVKALKNSYFIHTSSGSFQKPQFVYFGSKNLIDYFEGVENINFISERTIKFLINNYYDSDVIDSFFSECGVMCFPEMRVEESGVFIDGFECMIKKPSLKKTKAFIRLLISCPQEKFAPEVITYLENQRWIFLINDKVTSPAETELDKLSLKTGISESEALKINNLLRFKKRKTDPLNNKQIKLLGLFDRLNISEEDIDLFLKSSNDDFNTNEIINYFSPETEPNNENNIQTSLNFIGSLQNMLLAGFSDDVESSAKKMIVDTISKEYTDIKVAEIIFDDNPEDFSCDIIVKVDNQLEMLVYIAEKRDFGSALEINIEKWSEIEKNSETDLAEKTFLYMVSRKSKKILRFQNPSRLLSIKRMHKKSIILLFS